MDKDSMNKDSKNKDSRSDDDKTKGILSGTKKPDGGMTEISNADNKSAEGKSRKRKKVVIDPEYEWESLHHKSIYMNKRNVNQNIAGKHGNPHKRGISHSGKAMLLFMLGMIGSVAFILICTYMGVKVKKVKSYVKETLIAKETVESTESESDLETTTSAESQNEETVIAEYMAPVKEIEDLDVIGGNGELVGFSFPSKYHKEWILMEREFENALEAAGYEAEFRYAAGISSEDNSQSGSSLDEMVKQQIADIRELQEKGAKVIFISPADVTSLELGKVLNDVKNSGIYVVAIDHVPMHTSGVNYLFGCDDYHVGESLGWHIVDELDLINASASDPKCIEIFTGDFTDETLYFLYPGLMDILFPYIDTGALVVGSGQFELEQVSVMDNDRQEAKDRMQSILTTVYGKKKLDAVICTNDVLAEGVSEAIVSSMRDGSYEGTMPVITGDGCDDSALDRIIQGRQSMSVFHNPLEYAYRGTELADALLHGEMPDITDSEMYQNGNIVVPAVELSPVIVTKYNYEDEIVNRGYLQTAVLVD